MLEKITQYGMVEEVFGTAEGMWKTEFIPHSPDKIEKLSLGSFGEMLSNCLNYNNYSGVMLFESSSDLMDFIDELKRRVESLFLISKFRSYTLSPDANMDHWNVTLRFHNGSYIDICYSQLCDDFDDRYSYVLYSPISNTPFRPETYIHVLQVKLSEKSAFESIPLRLIWQDCTDMCVDYKINNTLESFLDEFKIVPECKMINND